MNERGRAKMRDGSPPRLESVESRRFSGRTGSVVGLWPDDPRVMRDFPVIHRRNRPDSALRFGRSESFSSCDRDGRFQPPSGRRIQRYRSPPAGDEEGLRTQFGPAGQRRRKSWFSCRRTLKDLRVRTRARRGRPKKGRGTSDGFDFMSGRVGTEGRRIPRESAAIKDRLGLLSRERSDGNRKPELVRQDHR